MPLPPTPQESNTERLAGVILTALALLPIALLLAPIIMIIVLYIESLFSVPIEMVEFTPISSSGSLSL